MSLQQVIYRKLFQNNNARKKNSCQKDLLSEQARNNCRWVTQSYECCAKAGSTLQLFTES